jgi:hypothetical protein
VVPRRPEGSTGRAAVRDDVSHRRRGRQWTMHSPRNRKQRTRWCPSPSCPRRGT